MKKVVNENQKSTLRKVLRYIRRYWGYLGASIILAAVTVALTLYLPILIGQAVDRIVGKGAVDFAGIFVILRKMAVIIGLTAVAQWVMNACNNKITYNVIRDIRTEAFEKIEKLPLKYLDAHSYGEIVSRVIADVDQFADGLLMGFTQFFTGIVTIFGTLIFMLTISVRITVAVVVITPVSLFVASFIAKKTFSMFKLQSETRGEQTAFIEEMVGNQKVVQAFSHEDEALEKFDEINERLQKYSLRAIFFSSITNPSTRFVNSLVYATVGVVGAFSAIAGGISVGQLSSLLSYANQYTKPFNEISGVITELQNALACAGRVIELIEEDAEVPDAEDAVDLEHANGKVELSHVYFSYVPEQKLIEDFNLSVKPGQRVAIVALYRYTDKCHCFVSDVCCTALSFRQRTGCLCGCNLHTLGRNLYDDGHSILVHDSCFYRKRKRARKSFCNGTFLCRRWFCNYHDHHRTFRIHAWQTGRRGKCIGN